MQLRVHTGLFLSLGEGLLTDRVDLHVDATDRTRSHFLSVSLSLPPFSLPCPSLPLASPCLALWALPAVRSFVRSFFLSLTPLYSSSAVVLSCNIFILLLRG